MIIENTDWAWPWWSAIVTINIINLVVCFLIFRRSRAPESDSTSKYRNRMRIMGLVFTLVGAYRAVFVSRYLTQMAWFDSILNSSLIIRMLAWAAELSFSGLIVLAMLQLNKDIPDSRKRQVKNVFSSLLNNSPYISWACIFVAQFFATGGVITKSRTLFAIEETFWTIAFLSVLPLSIIQMRRIYAVEDDESVKSLRMYRKSTVLIVSWCLIYVCYGLFYHLPLESWAGAINQIQTGLPILKSGYTSLFDALTLVNFSRNYEDWGLGFLFWHSSYFTICVWISIFLMRAPRRLNRPRLT